MKLLGRGSLDYKARLWAKLFCNAIAGRGRLDYKAARRFQFVVLAASFGLTFAVAVASVKVPVPAADPGGDRERCPRDRPGSPL